MRTTNILGATAALTVMATAVPAQAGDTHTWSTVDTSVTNTARPGLLRVGDSLDVVWTKSNGASSALYRRNYSAVGAESGVVTVLDGWSALAADPVPNAAGTAVSGLRGTPGGPGHWDGKALLTDGSGTIAGTLSSGLNAYLGEHDFDVVASLPVYLYSRTDQGKILLHTGLDPVASGATATTGPGPEYEVASGGCCMYYPSYRWDWWISDIDGTESAGWLAWYSNSSVKSEAGWLVRSMAGLPGPPIQGPVQQAPGALAGGGSVSATQRAALTRSAGGVWLAYPVGYPVSRSIRVWRLGTSTILTVKPGHSVTHPALASGPDGRLWLSYFSPDTETVYTVRSNQALTAFGQPAAIGNPVGNGGYLYSTAIDATTQRADVVVNSGDALHHRQSLPALSAVGKVVKVKPQKLLFKVTVTDAGDPMAGAKVVLGKASATTGGSGQAKLTIKKSALPKKLKGKAMKTAFYPARFVIGVKKALALTRTP